jgi:hypothetical protein
VKLHERFLDGIDDPDLWHIKRAATPGLYRLIEAGGCRHQAILAHCEGALEHCAVACDVCTGVSVAERVACSLAGALGRRATERRAQGGEPVC